MKFKPIQVDEATYQRIKEGAGDTSMSAYLRQTMENKPDVVAIKAEIDKMRQQIGELFQDVIKRVEDNAYNIETLRIRGDVHEGRIYADIEATAESIAKQDEINAAILSALAKHDEFFAAISRQTDQQAEFNKTAAKFERDMKDQFCAPVMKWITAQNEGAINGAK
jgi:hypothetical protein